MSQFIEKIGEKLHIGGHKKEGEHEHPPALHGTEVQHPPHAGEPHASEHDAEAVGQAGYGGVQGQHGEQHGTGVPPSHHEGPLEKVKNKIKGQKHDGGEEGSSSSSSESDGEGGRRKKKHGVF